MPIRVRVTASLLEDVFTEGEEIQAAKVARGLPAGSKLTRVQFDPSNAAVIELTFAHNDFLDRIVDIDVTFERVLPETKKEAPPSNVSEAAPVQESES